jgi:general secretion pathway protein K
MMPLCQNTLKVPYRKQQGVALITALLIAALITVAAVAMASRQQLDIRRTGNMLEADQAYLYALAAETLAVQMLKEDKQKTSIDTLDEDWAVELPPTLVEGGSISGSIEDMQGRFNLNNLVIVSGNNLGKPDTAQVKVLQSILEQVSEAEEGVDISRFMANRIADWIDPNLNSLADGAEDLDYLGLIAPDVPYRAANRLMASPSELAAVLGLSLSDVDVLLPLVAALPEDTQVNVNTAPEMVLLSLHEDITPRIAAELAEFRGDTPFETADEFVKKLKDDYQIGTTNENAFESRLVSVDSEYFLVTSDAAIGRTTLRLYSLLARKDDGIYVVSRGIGSY